MYNLIYSFISFIIALFFILIGGIAVLIPWSAKIRTDLIQFILEDALAISLFGFAFMVIGLASAASILLNAKRKYYHIKSGDQAVFVDEALIQQYLSLYWKQLFPLNDIPCRLSLKKNKVYISADLPPMPQSEQRPLLERIRKDLTQLFEKKLGYHEQISFSISFQKN